MSKRIATAALAAAALALTAPGALADQPTFDCRLRSVQQDTVTGGTFQGVLTALIVYADGPVSIRCFVTVNGVPRAQAAASGDRVAVAAEEVSFAAGDSDVMRLCADYTSGHGAGTWCASSGWGPFPPDFVYETLDGVLSQVWPVVDPVVCAALKAIAPGAGTVYVNGQGDVYVDGEPQWDCPPYDVDWG
ncbi:MAG TPA: hypothetical protein VNA20_19005 [Frankiaceae bacterium]|nr:hypothetical protein [Frankiaceae bacterium]